MSHMIGYSFMKQVTVMYNKQSDTQNPKDKTKTIQ